MDSEKLVSQFISAMSSKHSDVLFAYKYNEREDIYQIYHSNQNIHKDIDFKHSLSASISEIFALNSFFSFAIDVSRELMPVVDYSSMFTDMAMKNEIHLSAKPFIDGNVGAIIVLESSVNNFSKWDMDNKPENKTSYSLAA